jgi:hypothetical protein
MVTQPHERIRRLLQKRIAPLLDKIDHNALKSTVYIEVKQYKNRIRRLQKRQRSINIGFAYYCRFIALLVYNLWAGNQHIFPAQQIILITIKKLDYFSRDS